MTETDIQRYAREIAAVDLTIFDLSHPTTTEYRLAHEVVRLRAILAALREPSEAVLLAARKHIVSMGVTTMRDTQDVICAAVEAAEQEVANDAS